jgi:hypothetical protein
VIDRIETAGEPAPGGGTLQRFVPADVNARGDVLFAGDLTTPPRRFSQIGIFLHTASGTVAIARPGDLMPDGSHFITGGLINDQLSLNDTGQVAFVAKVDSDIAGDGLADTAVYRFKHGSLELVARSGMVIPGIGDIRSSRWTASSRRGRSEVPYRRPRGRTVSSRHGDPNRSGV